jgi:hypothetical protein
MYALITDGSITKHLSGNRGIQVGDIKYARDIFSKWTEAERNAIGIFEIISDNTKQKDDVYYHNTNQTFTYDADAGTVTATYGDATAKPHADTLWTAQDESDGKGTEGEVAYRGLKYNFIQKLKSQVADELKKTDWYVIRKTEKSTAIPSAITNHRNAVRTKQASMETAITNASDTAALETLYTYTEQEDGSTARPLGELPTL